MRLLITSIRTLNSYRLRIHPRLDIKDILAQRTRGILTPFVTKTSTSIQTMDSHSLWTVSRALLAHLLLEKEVAERVLSPKPKGSRQATCGSEELASAVL